MRRAYVDSCVCIYWVEQEAPQSEAALRWLADNADAVLHVSPLVRLEVMVKPMRLHQIALIDAYELLLSRQTWLSINDAIFAHALDLRSQFGLKTPDALHLATAQHHGCNEIWTNDNRLKVAAGAMAVHVLATTDPSSP
ncbi:type II toxin-antitoxin system VapC family toxin [Candidatus Symbiobacter mobilis]|uniref:Ribonuclease VapC n=1 Tax=Candidatus Symbiobacter mobilis CR TaxID=946483 RepID=U5N610_9BURK|nr:type II toxin-antitoxin system VapC family toxin [Candidatus Symbiobacter mobilis]AGX86720.1 PilT domain protein [Candidatus Symbiobacter mobilis CR]